jgi:uncharacterized damage-inducible protein DinB
MDPMVAPYAKILDGIHKDAAAIVTPLGEDTVNRRVPGLQNTVGILMRHMAGSERYWVGEIVGGIAAHRNRDAEFAGDRVDKAAALTEMDRAAATSRQVLSGLRAADLLTEVEIRRGQETQRETRGQSLLHATQHLAYHLGQLRIVAKLAQT